MKVGVCYTHILYLSYVKRAESREHEAAPIQCVCEKSVCPEHHIEGEATCVDGCSDLWQRTIRGSVLRDRV